MTRLKVQLAPHAVWPTICARASLDSQPTQPTAGWARSHQISRLQRSGRPSCALTAAHQFGQNAGKHRDQRSRCASASDSVERDTSTSAKLVDRTFFRGSQSTASIARQASSLTSANAVRVQQGHKADAASSTGAPSCLAPNSLHNADPIACSPSPGFRTATEYCIAMRHGRSSSFSSPDRRQNVTSQKIDASCTTSNYAKLKPDSRGTSPAMTK